ncbi:3722_t:CDS:2, partial [Gigaspora margarita]
GEWQWPNNAPYASQILAQKNFIPAQIAKVTKITLTQPTAQIFEHSTPKSSWKVPLYRTNYSNNASCLDLIDLLQKEMFFETTKELNERKNHLLINNIDFVYANEQSNKLLNLTSWTLKKNQKYGKKGSRKQISPCVLELLKAMFMAGQEDHSQQNSAKEMFDELLQMAEEVHLTKVVDITDPSDSKE